MTALSPRSRLGLILSPLLVLLGIAVLVSTQSVLDYRTSLVSSRAPVYSSEEDASLMFRVDNAFFEGNLINVVYYEPLNEQAPIPPGLDSWLKPGTVAISSALAGKEDYVERQFGEIAGYIDDSVLLNEREAIVFVRPETSENWRELALEEEKVYFGSGFGVGDTVPYGFINYENWSHLLLPLLALALIPTILIFVVTSRKYARISVRSTQHSLILIGASKGVLRRYLFRSFAPWLAIGALAALLVQIVVLVHGMTIPVVSFTVQPVMLHPSLVFIIAGDVLFFLLLLFFFTTPNVRARTKHARVRTRTGLVGLVFFVVGIACASAIGIAGNRLPEALFIVLIFVTILCVCLGIPSAFTVLFRVLARVYLRQHTLSLFTPFMRWIDNNASNASRNASVAGIVIVLGAFFVTYYAILVSATELYSNESPKNAYATEMRFTCSGISSCGQTALETVVEKAPDATHFAYISTDEGSYNLTYIPNGKEDEIQIREFIKEKEMQYGANNTPIDGARESYGFIYSLSDTPIVNSLQTVRFGDFIPLTGNIEDTDRALGSIYTQHAQWFILAMYITFLIALLISLSSSTQKISEEAKEFASLAALTGQRKKISKHLVSRSSWLTVWGAGVGTIVGGFIAIQIAPALFLGMLGRFIAVTISIFILAELIEGVIYYREVKRWARKWKPGQGTGAL